MGWLLGLKGSWRGRFHFVELALLKGPDEVRKVCACEGPAAGAGDLISLVDVGGPLAGRSRVHIIDATLATGAVLLTLPLAWATPLPAITAAAIGLISVLALLLVIAYPDQLRRLRASRPGANRDRMVGLAAGLAIWGALGFEMGLAVGLVVGLGLGVTAGMGGPPSKEARPWEILRDDLVVNAAVGLTCGLTLGLVAWLTFGLAIDWTRGLTIGLIGGLGCVLVVVVGAAARRYAVFLLCSRRRLPFRLVVFLDWACEAGLLRYVGPAYQFRHREVQQWLTTHPHPVDPPPDGSDSSS